MMKDDNDDNDIIIFFSTCRFGSKHHTIVRHLIYNNHGRIFCCIYTKKNEPILAIVLCLNFVDFFSTDAGVFFYFKTIFVDHFHEWKMLNKQTKQKNS